MTTTNSSTSSSSSRSSSSSSSSTTTITTTTSTSNTNGPLHTTNIDISDWLKNIPNAHWYFTKEEIMKHYGPDKAEILSRRSSCAFIQDLGVMLKLSQLTIATATTYFHRFFIRHQLRDHDRFVIATTCLFLAGKVEESYRYVADVAISSYKARYKVLKPKDSPEIRNLIKNVVDNEHLLLTTIAFELTVQHPYKYLLEYMKMIQGKKELCQIAWNFVNDSLRTNLCLHYPPDLISYASVYLATKYLKCSLSSEGKKQWWEILNIKLEVLEDISNQILDLYESPTILSSSSSTPNSQNNNQSENNTSNSNNTNKQNNITTPSSSTTTSINEQQQQPQSETVDMVVESVNGGSTPNIGPSDKLASSPLPTSKSSSSQNPPKSPNTPNSNTLQVPGSSSQHNSLSNSPKLSPSPSKIPSSSSSSSVRYSPYSKPSNVGERNRSPSPQPSQSPNSKRTSIGSKQEHSRSDHSNSNRDGHRGGGDHSHHWNSNNHNYQQGDHHHQNSHRDGHRGEYNNNRDHRENNNRDYHTRT